MTRTERGQSSMHRSLFGAKKPNTVQSVCVLSLCIAAWTPAKLEAQTAQNRPIPNAVVASSRFKRAVSKGTRTESGKPGPRYWQQSTQYTLSATLDSATHTLNGRGTVSYTNNSPDTLPRLAFYAYQNLYRPGSPRLLELPLTAGLSLTRVAVEGRALTQSSDAKIPGYAFATPTVFWIRLPTALLPGASVKLDFEWSFQVPGPGDLRMGQDGDVHFLAYWYPQVAVYDDVDGWNTDQYLGWGEFYMGYADYSVELTVPAGWLVGATGVLQNEQEVLNAPTRGRLSAARRSSGLTRIVTDAERGHLGGSTSGQRTWKYSAHSTRDFAWGTSRNYVWDATRVLVTHPEARRVDTVMVHALYRPGTIGWDASWRETKEAVDFMSNYLWPYPYPQVTSIEGLLGGGEEFPMITLMHGAADSTSYYGVLAHEIAHMWFPIQVGSDERRFAWMDEGTTVYNSAQILRLVQPGINREAAQQETYRKSAARDQEFPSMLRYDQYPPGDAGSALGSYAKPATVLASLRTIMGDSAFVRAYRAYGMAWQYKHPQPFDFFNSFEREYGKPLDWFWRSWLYETWKLDQAIGSVTPAGDSLDIVIEDRGFVPMPVRIRVTRVDGSVERVDVPVDVWLAGATRHLIRIHDSPRVQRIDIDPEHLFPDVDQLNQSWIR